MTRSRSSRALLLLFSCALSGARSSLARRLPTHAELVRSGVPLSHFRSRFAGAYDRDGDGVVTRAEINRVFEYLSVAQREAYWSECDTAPPFGALDYAEWLPCAGAYSDNGERFHETEWDELVQEGLLSLDGGSRPGRSEEF